MEFYIEHIYQQPYAKIQFPDWLRAKLFISQILLTQMAQNLTPTCSECYAEYFY